MTPVTYAWLFLAGFAGGFIDAIAGGGGLITLPALLATGMPPQMALGTNKLQSSCGTAVAVWRFSRAGLTGAPGLKVAVVAAFLASMAGAQAVSVVDPSLLKRIIPWLLAAVAIYTALNRRFGIETGRPKVSPVVFAVLFGIAIGFYDGFFGPGTGSFWTLATVALLGLELKGATGYTKAANLSSNVGSLVIFFLHGSIHAGAAGAMICGQLIGARLGSGLVVTKGVKLIRPVFLTVVFAMTVKLLWDAWG